jgi:hypothetical protein
MAALTPAEFVSFTDKIAALYNSLWGDGQNFGAGLIALPLATAAGTGVTSGKGTNAGNVTTAAAVAGQGNLGQVTGAATTFQSLFSPGYPMYITGATPLVARVQMVCSNTALVAVIPGSLSLISGFPSGQPNLTQVTTAAAYLAPDYGASRKARDLEAQIFGTNANAVTGLAAVSPIGDYSSATTLGPNVHGLQSVMQSTNLIGLISGALASLDTACRNVGTTLGVSSIVDLISFANYYNFGAGASYVTGPPTVNTNACLVAPDFAIAYEMIRGTWPAGLALNAYAPGLSNMGSYVDSTTTFTAGAAVNTATHGGYPTLTILTTGNSGGTTSGTVAISVTGYNEAGTIITDTWTSGTISTNNVATNIGPERSANAVSSIPNATTSVVQVTQVTGMAVTGLSNATNQIAGIIPSSRNNPSS